MKNSSQVNNKQSNLNANKLTKYKNKSEKSILKITISALKTFLRVIKTHNIGSLQPTIKMAANERSKRTRERINKITSSKMIKVNATSPFFR